MIRGVPTRLTSAPGANNIPSWSPDGLRIFFPSNRNGTFDLYVKSATGAGQEEVLVRMGTPTGWGTDWSRDARYILYQIPGGQTGQDLWSLRSSVIASLPLSADTVQRTRRQIRAQPRWRSSLGRIRVG